MFSISDKYESALTAAIYSPAMTRIELNRKVPIGVYSVKSNERVLHELAPHIFAEPADTAQSILENLQKIVKGTVMPGDVYVYTSIEVGYINDRIYLINHDSFVNRAATVALQKQLRVYFDETSNTYMF
jgi:hypothetical protein